MQAHTLDEFDRHLLQFFLTWAPFGGPTEEDVYPRFGLDTAAGWRRFKRVTASGYVQLLRLSADDAKLILRAATWISGSHERA
jgi:hypothetical protein